jgi:hypothetical protein
MRLTPSGHLVATMPVIAKARMTKSGQRIIEINASDQIVDTEGDVILQSALLNSADEFVRSGVLDLDHISEIGERLGIARPLDYIIGTPLAAYAGDDKRTNVTGLILQGRAKADEFWDSLTDGVRWAASIYGFPHHDGLIRVADDPDHELVKRTGARRFVVTGIYWRSLAITRNPICYSVNRARVLTYADAAGLRRAA